MTQRHEDIKRVTVLFTEWILRDRERGRVTVTVLFTWRDRERGRVTVIFTEWILRDRERGRVSVIYRMDI